MSTITFRVTTLCIFLFFLFGNRTLGQDFQWAKQIGNTGWDQVSDMALDDNNNVFLFGEFRGTVDFDPGPGVFNLSSVGEKDAFICKLNEVGNLIWVKQFGDSAYIDKEGSLAIDASGNIYITSSFLGVADFDPGTGIFNLTSAGSDRDIFILKLSSNGNFIWAKQISGQPSAFPSPTHSFDIAVDANGNQHLTGYFDSTVDFDPDTSSNFNLTAIAYSDIFICKLDKDGNLIWAKQLGGTQGGVGYSLALDNNSNVYSTGTIGPTATVDFDPGPGVYNLTSSDSMQSEIYISKLDSNGDFVWAKLMGVGTGRAIAVDGSGNSYSSGEFPQGTAPMLNKLNPSGSLIWSKQIGNNVSGESIALDSGGHVYITGSSFGTNDFDPGSGIFSLTGGNSDFYLSKLETSGNFVWAGLFTGSSQVWANSVTLDISDNIYLAGYFDGTADFDPDTIASFPLITPITSYNAFVLQLQSNSTVGFSENDLVKNIRVYPNPTHGKLRIDFETVHDAQKIVLRTITGQVVIEKLVNKSNSIEMQFNEPPGVYILDIYDSLNQKVSFKIVKH